MDDKMRNIMKHVDHTLLAQTATDEDIKQLCNDAAKYGCASVCVPPSFVGFADSYLMDQYPESEVKVCTVIGFPNGYSTTETKVFETKRAIAEGADEIDMVANIGWEKEHCWLLLENEIEKVKEACGDRVLKVIVETCLLDDEEKAEMCRVVGRAGADYIKTSTGFSTGGATFDDIALFAESVDGDTKIKASGGISSFEDAEKFLSLGADRLGTSRLVKIAKASESE